MKFLRFKKLGNHWYPDIQHESLDDIRLSEKIERVLSYLSKDDTISVYLYEENCMIYKNTIQFEDKSMCRYFTTNDDFEIIFWIGDHKYSISSNLYYILESLFQFNFHDTFYCINISE